MTLDHSSLGRLLKRLPTGLAVPIRWNVSTSRRPVGHGQQESVRGHILDLSIEGALVEVPLSTGNAIGDRVTIEFDGTRQVEAVIRHHEISESGDLMHYGIQFVETAPLAPVICELVDSISGRPPDLLDVWNHSI